MPSPLPLTLVIGLAAGFFSGQFGIGGGLVTTPALRLLLGAPELIAVGTPLPVIIPTALAGAWSYFRRGLADVRLGVTMGVVGGAFAVAGALGASRVGGRIVLLVTAVLIGFLAIDMLRLALRPRHTGREVADGDTRSRSLAWVAALGAVAGLSSGFLGLGGGFVIVPALTRFFAFPVKRAIGTSLVAVSILAIPGSVSHFLLGNVDVALALVLALGVVPGAMLGSRVTAMAREKSVRVGFALMLLATGALLGITEAGLL